MVAIGLSAGSVARVRFAVSALWEVAASVRVLRAPGHHSIHRPWAARVRPELQAAGLLDGLLWALVPAAPGYLADFLTPPVDGLSPRLDAELATLRATPPSTVRADLARYRPRTNPAIRAASTSRGLSGHIASTSGGHTDSGPPTGPTGHGTPTASPTAYATLAPGASTGRTSPGPTGHAAPAVGASGGLDERLALLHADPVAGLERLAREIEAYWELALAADWPRIRALLDAEVFARSRALAEDGVGGLLNDLHDRVTFTDGTLSVAGHACTASDVRDGGGIVLVPSVFAWPDVLAIPDAATPQLAYPARGVATLWERPPEPSAALADLIGRTRAQLLTAMASPKSTNDLARECGLTPGGVSQHLSVLRAAGLVTAHRNGRSVVNSHTSKAKALLKP